MLRSDGIIRTQASSLRVNPPASLPGGSDLIAQATDPVYRFGEQRNAGMTACLEHLRIPHQAPPKPKDTDVLFDHFLNCINREDNLIHYRSTWGMQWNFAALASVVALNTANHLPVADDAQKTTFLFWATFIVSLCGIFISWTTYHGIEAAKQQINYLRRRLVKSLGISTANRVEDWEKSEYFRPYGDLHSVYIIGNRASKIVPLLFIAIWLLIDIISFRSFPDEFAINISPFSVKLGHFTLEWKNP